MEKVYWKGLEELRGDAEFVKAKQNEFAEPLPLDKAISQKSEDTSGMARRDFLKFLGFGVTAASLAACEAPVKKTIPYLIKPEEVIPGVANWYASTYADGYDYCSIVVKTREGRPIKIEGNERSSVTAGGTNARVQASVLSLYDSTRLKGPLANGKETTWADTDRAIADKLGAIAMKNGHIRILTSSVVSPSAKKVLADFAAKFPTAKVVTCDAVSYSGMIAANLFSFDKAVVPSYRFDKAGVIVGIGADFLANWLSPIEHSRQYAATRKLHKNKKVMSRHIQFETLMSVTGSNADERIAIKPSQESAVVLGLYNKIASMAGAPAVAGPSSKHQAAIDKAAKELWDNKGKALVVSGSNDKNIQTVVNAINSLLDSYGNTIDLDNHSNMQQSDDEALAGLIREMNEGKVDALLIHNCNPVYTLPKNAGFEGALEKAGLKVSFATTLDETAAKADFVCPDHHYLEAWSDAEPKKGKFSLGQPTIAPLFNSRSAQESLLKWAGVEAPDYHAYIQQYWKTNIFPQQKEVALFETFWTGRLQEGVFELPEVPAQNYKFSKDLSAAASAVGAAREGESELIVYQKTGIGNGNQANNPWLQEMPDPISKICWDNYVTVSPAFAKAKGWEQGAWISVQANGSAIDKLPVLIQPGQANGTIGIALGYGRTHAGKTADGVGKNAYALTSLASGAITYSAADAKVSAVAGDKYVFAATQTHHTMMGRAVVKETNLAAYAKDPAAGNEQILIHTAEGKKQPEEVSLWEEYAKPNHLWGMVVDLNSCTGCGACVIGCQAENNVSVVGRDEVRRSREMHWIRIDRYYSSDMTKEKAKKENIGKIDMWDKMEEPSENPEVVFQPIMCQHCNHAPCETVCPVIATSHSSEGLNQMTYNRCVGTRYCANNCPYKVRRFNWFKYFDNPQFDYNMNDGLGKMVLNPDVVVRSRGVMEKCSLCVQRIQEGKLNAKKDGRRPKDGEIKTACAQACPTNAITFGDWLDKDSEINRLKDERAYHLLEELNVQPNIMYLTKVRNKGNA